MEAGFEQDQQAGRGVEVGDSYEHREPLPAPPILPPAAPGNQSLNHPSTDQP